MAIGNVSTAAPAQTLFSSPTPVATGTDADGDSNGSRVGAAGGGGRFAAAISQALTQIGVTAPDGSTASAGSTSSTTQDPKQAEQAFSQALFGALQGQNGGAAQGSDGAHKGGGHHHHGGGGGVSKVESGLQNLIQQLTSGSAANGSSAAGSSTATTTDGSALSNLQSSFDKLVAANGGTAGTANLTSFLQNLAQNLQGAPSTGNVVSTKA